MRSESASRPVVFVTGGGRGAGREICIRAGEAGWDVAFTYLRDKQAAFDTVTAIEATGAQGAAFQADVSVQREVRNAFSAAVDRFGRLDGLVNNAGVTGPSRLIGDVDEAHLCSVFKTNVFGVFYCTGEAVRRMSAETGGSGGTIVNISSAAARHGGAAKESHYAASKGAIDSFTLAMAKELGPQGIRVNAVRPGTPGEVAAVVLFLLGPSASYLHGALLDLGGGW